MKAYLYLLLFILPNISSAQRIEYKKTFAQASLEASYLKKKLLVIVNSDSSEIKNQKVLFEDIDIINEINREYVVYKTNFHDAELNYVYKYYSLCNCPTFLFLHPSKNVFYKSLAFDASKEKFLKILANASMVSKEKDATELHRRYNSDTTNVEVLKELIDVRKKGGIYNNAYFIEKYANFLGPSDYKNYQTVLFILEAGPRLGGIAYSKAYTNRNVIDSIFKTESMANLSNIGTNMINNTIDIAIKTKCLADAINVANYYKNQWKNDKHNGQKIYNEKMLFYYEAIKDTASYFQTSIRHYNEYYMNIKVDSVNKIKLEEKQNANLPTPRWKAKSYQDNLNKTAWTFYILGTKNRNHLLTAIKWSKRSIELEPKADYYFTLAHLYYRYEDFAKAEKAIQTAINKVNGEEPFQTNFKKSQIAIKNKTL